MQSARPILTALALVAASPSAGAPPASDDLYAATVIVTGRDNLAERERGIGEALAAVLVRASADPAVGRRFGERRDPTPSADWVTGLDYLDRKAGIQISDEQGARDRSFELTVAFEPAAIDALLAELDAKPWPAPRPTIPVDLVVRTDARTYRLTETGENGYAQRLSLIDAAQDLGLAIELPADEVSSFEGSAALAGDMRITGAGLWDSDWRLGDGAAARTHTVSGQSFDATFEDALAFAASNLKAPR